LKNLIKNLPAKKFLRVHKSHIIGVDFIEFLEGNRIRVKEKNIPVGQSYRKEVAHFFGK
jgi:DNA-binding LytR/AlgR family response regulator